MLTGQRHLPACGNHMFYLCGLFLALCAVAGLYVPISGRVPAANTTLMIILSGLLLVIAALFLVYPSIQEAKRSILVDFPRAVSQAEDSLLDMKTALREIRKSRDEIVSLYEAVRLEHQGLLEIRRTAAQDAKERQALEEALMAARQEVASRDRKLDYLQDLAIEFLQSIERTGDLPAYAEAMEKAAKYFSGLQRALEIEIIRPSANEPCLLREHKVVSEETPLIPEVMPGHVISCRAQGYKKSQQVVWPAEVVIASPTQQLSSEQGATSSAKISNIDDTHAISSGDVQEN